MKLLQDNEMLRGLPLILCIAVASSIFVQAQAKQIQHPKPLTRNDASNRLKFHASAEVLERWSQFKAEHGKSYSKDEEATRMKIFTDNLQEIREHNELYDQGKTTYRKGVNQFTDMSSDEFTEIVLRPPIDDTLQSEDEEYEIPKELWSAAAPLPKSWDWRSRGVVTRVKNQGSCLAGWAFSAVATLESHLAVKYGQKVYLSEQNLVDCARVPEYTNSGCKGGEAGEALRYAMVNGGLDTEDSYQYEATDGMCRYDPETKAKNLKVLEAYTYRGKPETLLQGAVAQLGPVSAAIDATALQQYSSGIFNGPCTNETNHDVSVVGYGSSGHEQYWIIKNSWGIQWGMDGFFLLARNKSSLCGIGSDVSFPRLG